MVISLALIPILGILGQWIAWRVRLPSIIVLLFLGFLSGPVLSIVDTDQIFGDMLYPLVSLLVSIIVFEGGLNLRMSDLKNIGPSLIRLVTIAPLITIGLMYVASYYILGLSSDVSIMFSALMVITGPTVIIPLLRHIKVSPRLSSLIRWEGILIAPIGTFLIVLVYQWMFISSDHVLKLVLLLLFKIVLVSLLVGSIMAGVLVTFFKRNWVPNYLQELTTLVFVMSSFVLSNVIQQDSGILTVVLMGIIVANQQHVALQHVKVFKENLRILSISTLFIILSSRLVFDDLLVLFDLKHGIYLLSLIFLVRPVATAVSLIGTSMPMKERVLMAWIAPRGIVTASIASLFALRLVDLGVPNAEVLVPLTFLVLIFTVMVYGFSLNPFIQWIRLEDDDKIDVLVVGANRVALAIAKALGAIESVNVTIVDSNRTQIQYSRIDGIKSMHSSVFSSRVSDDMHLGAFQYLVALTENDEVNSLSCIQYAEIIGANNVFRFSPLISNTIASDGFSKKIEMGRELATVNMGHCDWHIRSGGDVEQLTVQDSMSATSFFEDATPVLGVSETNELIPAKGLTVVKKGQRWIVLRSYRKSVDNIKRNIV